MTEYEAYQEHIRYTHDMQNFMRTYQRDFSRRNVFKCLQIATTKNRLN